MDQNLNLRADDLYALGDLIIVPSLWKHCGQGGQTETPSTLWF